MLINLSNHPSEKWSSVQKTDAINQFSEIADITFPHIDPEADENYIVELAKSYRDECINLFKEKSVNKYKDNGIHIMGEFTFTYALVNLLLNEGIKCLASTTKRIIKELDTNKSEVTFEFVRFREYKSI